jgi:hypothetical protein
MPTTDILRYALDQHAIVSITNAAGDLLEVNDKFCSISGALLHKIPTRQHSPNPKCSYATATVSGVPSCVKQLSNATRTCSSVT